MLLITAMSSSSAGEPGLKRSSLSGSKPNIMLLFADDQYFETIAALKMTDIETPNPDRLMQRGTLLSHAYDIDLNRRWLLHTIR